MKKHYELIIDTEEKDIDRQAMYVENYINNNFDNLKIEVIDRTTKESIHNSYLGKYKNEKEPEKPNEQRTL